MNTGKQARPMASLNLAKKYARCRVLDATPAWERTAPERIRVLESTFASSQSHRPTMGRLDPASCVSLKEWVASLSRAQHSGTTATMKPAQDSERTVRVVRHGATFRGPPMHSTQAQGTEFVNPRHEMSRSGRSLEGQIV